MIKKFIPHRHRPGLAEQDDGISYGTDVRISDIIPVILAISRPVAVGIEVGVEVGVEVGIEVGYRI